jgi:hypothetical protein
MVTDFRKKMIVAIEIFVCRSDSVLFQAYITGKSGDTIPLKVPKREIFDRSDFPDFYTIKSLRVGDFGVKMKKK